MESNLSTLYTSGLHIGRQQRRTYTKGQRERLLRTMRAEGNRLFYHQDHGQMGLERRQMAWVLGVLRGLRGA